MNPVLAGLALLGAASFGGRKFFKTFKIEGVEKVREGTYRFYVDAGKEGSLRVIVYPDPLPMQVLGAGNIQYLESDLTDAQKKKLRDAAKKGGKGYGR